MLFLGWWITKHASLGTCLLLQADPVTASVLGARAWFWPHSSSQPGHLGAGHVHMLWLCIEVTYLAFPTCPFAYTSHRSPLTAPLHPPRWLLEGPNLLTAGVGWLSPSISTQGAGFTFEALFSFLAICTRIELLFLPTLSSSQIRIDSNKLQHHARDT